MITIVDYGLGNVAAFLNMYKRMNIPARAARNSEELTEAERIILPGVGAFDHAMKLLDSSGMRATLDRLVQRNNRPIMGVCVGMQILTDGSDEGSSAGLGWIPGRTRAFADHENSKTLALPHMGWNDVKPGAGHQLFESFGGDARFYFLHSYYVDPANREDIAATTNYGHEFACAIHHGNVWGVQFHPEKSHHWGAMLLKNFAGI
jgi:glutamine amidotransferase